MPPILLTPVKPDTLLKHTTSRCPVCHAACPAEVWRTGHRPAKVFLKRHCPTHGEASVCIASDARFYWLAKGNPGNDSACCGGGAFLATDTITTMGCLPGAMLFIFLCTSPVNTLILETAPMNLRACAMGRASLDLH